MICVYKDCNKIDYIQYTHKKWFSVNFIYLISNLKIRTMSKVMIATLKEGGKIGAYNVSEGKEAWGYMHVQSTENRFVNGIFKKETRHALLRGPVAGLQEVVNTTPMGELPGKIVIVECCENDIPVNIAKSELNKKLIDAGDFEGAIAPYVKKAGNDGDVLMKDGQRILRFSRYTEDMNETDVYVQHDNQITGSSVVTAEAEVQEFPTE